MFQNLPRMSVAVLGSGPRALATAICLSRHHAVALGEAGDYRSRRQLARLPMYPDETKLDEFLHRMGRSIKFTDSYQGSLTTADLVVVSAQPQYRIATRSFDMAPIERCLDAVRRHRPRATVVLEAPTPVGYALKASLEHRIMVIPAPWLMREGHVAIDRALPRHIVVGSSCERGLNYAFMAVRSSRDHNTPYLLTNASEAEAIHAFERKRIVRGHSESIEEVVDYCKRQRLDEDQVLRGLQPLTFVRRSQVQELLSV